MSDERFDTVVIGGGQAGMAAGYLGRQRRDFVILDAATEIGETWRSRWDALRLFTPAHFTRLPGLRFPARRGHLPSKDEMADYLQTYAAHFELPLPSGCGSITSAETRTATCSHPPAGPCEPATSSWPPALRWRRGYRASSGSSIPASTRCTPPTTATPPRGRTPWLV